MPDTTRAGRESWSEGMTQSAVALPVLGRIARALDADLTVRIAARPDVA